MSNNKSWTKRTTEIVVCPSGVECVVRRPGPEVWLRGGKIIHILQKMAQDEEVKTTEELLAKLGELTDEGFIELMHFAREMVLAVVVSPKLSAKPSPGIETDIGPDDLPLPDFFFLFSYGITGAPGIPVRMKEGETTVAAVESFPVQETPSDRARDNRGAESEESV